MRSSFNIPLQLIRKNDRYFCWINLEEEKYHWSQWHGANKTINKLRKAGENLRFW
ncbi:MAG: hypothetical protein PHP26_08570 [Syntrophomonas sp.]|nr:hypothetical protein [Syntrophomonas sp.]